MFFLCKVFVLFCMFQVFLRLRRSSNMVLDSSPLSVVDMTMVAFEEE